MLRIVWRRGYLAYDRDRTWYDLDHRNFHRMQPQKHATNKLRHSYTKCGGTDFQTASEKPFEGQKDPHPGKA